MAIAADPEGAAAAADEMAMKTLLEQMLMKMKNLREEMTKSATVRPAS